jgi:hypothetical protein
MLRIDPLAAQVQGRYGVQTDRVVQIVRRYVLFSAGIAVASLAVAFGVSLTAVLLAGRANQSAQTRAEAYFQEVSSASGQIILVKGELLDPDPDNPDLPSTFPVPPAAPVLVENVVRHEVPDRFIHNKKGSVSDVNITFYDCKGQGFCGSMYGGRKVYQGAAACSWDLALGTTFYIVGDPTRRVYICEDRGLLRDTWVDVFWNSPRDGWWWASQVGRKGTIEIVGLP